MKRAWFHIRTLRSCSLAGLLLVALVFHGCTTGSGGRPFTLDIVHINDTHSHLGPFKLNITLNGTPTRVQAGGFPRVKSAVDAIRDKEKNVLFLHAGDAVQGTLYFTKYRGRADMDFLNLLGTDAMCPGNHEFDKGPDLLAGLINMAGFPFVSANIDASGDPKLFDRIVPYVIKRFGTLKREKVAIIGVTTPDTSLMSSAGPTLTFEDPDASVSKTVDLLKSEGINKIIVLSHLGYKHDIVLAGEVPGIDVIVGGHSHTLLGDSRDFADIGLTATGNYPTVIEGPGDEKVLVVQAWRWSGILGELKVTFDGDGHFTGWSGGPTLILGDIFMQKGADQAYVPLRKSSARYKAALQAIRTSRVAAVYPENPAAAKKLAFYSASLKKVLDEVAAQAEDRLRRGDNCGPGPLIADSMLWKTAKLKTRIAILNSGGVRKDLASGPVTAGDVHELLPFDDTLVVMDLSGAQIKDSLEEGVEFILSRAKRGPYVYVSGMSFVIDESRPRGERIELPEVKDPDGSYSAMDPGATYRIVTNSFMAVGGDGYAALKHSRGYRLDTGFVDADVFMQYVRTLGTLSNPTETRIIVRKDR